MSAFNGSTLSKRDLDRTLDTILPRADNRNVLKAIIRDNEFVRIAELLRMFGKGEWSLRPRTFAILRMLGCEEAMDAFVEENRSDFYLPYTESNLPAAIKGAPSRSKFIQLQKLVLSQQGLAKLETGKTHIHFNGLADEYFCYIDGLGVGKFGTVDHVYSILSLQQYARKRIVRGLSCMKDRRMLESFENDLVALKALSHRHIVKLVGSYTDPTYVGIIMTPVADMNLWDYLTSEINQNVRKQYLRTFFGCLASALAYLHSNNVRHKDIKPQNILVQGSSVFLTDFGTSRIWEEGENSTTEGPVSAYTPRYSAPEVADGIPRGSASDVWSLGCVFLEMATVLNGHKLSEMKEFYADNGTQAPHFYLNTAATQSWIKLLRDTFADEDDKPLKWISWMLKIHPKERPTSHQIISEITDTSSSYSFMCNICSVEKSNISFIPSPRPNSHEPVKEELSRPRTSTSVRDISLKSYNGPVTAEYLSHLKGKTGQTNYGESKSKNDATALSETGDERSSSHSCRWQEHQNLETANKPHAVAEHPYEHQDIKDAPPPYTTRSVRFGILPTSRRPEPSSIPFDEDEPADQLIAEPLKPPPIRQEDCLPLPRITMAPSYILAGTNRFCKEEYRELSDRTGLHNLFVYGRMMFPSILRKVAAQSMVGIYSKIHQRRVRCTSADWQKADMSIKMASEIMTPASLTGYDRWHPKGFDYAVLQDSRMTSRIENDRRDRGYRPLSPRPTGKVVGFVILGLTEEALRFCDVLLTHRRKPFDSEHKDDGPDVVEEHLQRRTVEVDVETSEGSIIKIEAITYVWSNGVEGLRHTWSPDHFLRGRAMRELTGDHKDLVAEEHTLAKIMHISYALPGDYLYGAISRGDKDELGRLLDDGYNANVPCRVYGYPLQAAISMGNEDMVRLLIDSGADINAKGGRYETPLLAATHCGHKKITKLLLHEKANMFEGGGMYVSPLYQAVGHSDLDIAEMLLERGAWLGKDYEELLDLAAERHDRKMKNLLAQYDVSDLRRRQLHQAGKSERRQRGREIEDRPPQTNDGLVTVSSRVLKAVLTKFFILQTQRGGWRGLKGVTIMRAAIDAGAPPSILDDIQNAMDPVMMVIQNLAALDQSRERGRAEKDHVDGVENKDEDAY